MCVYGTPGTLKFTTLFPVYGKYTKNPVVLPGAFKRIIRTRGTFSLPKGTRGTLK